MKKSTARSLTREQTAVQRRATGASQRAIACELGIGQPAVSRALQRAEARLRQAIPDELAGLRRREDASISAVIVECWSEWLRSKHVGSPRPVYLRLALRALKDRAELWSLRAPRSGVAVTINGRTPSQVEGLTDEELLLRARQELAEFAIEISVGGASAPLDVVPTLSPPCEGARGESDESSA